MTKRGDSFTFTWEIKNASFCWQRRLQFIEKSFDTMNHHWSLMLYPSTPINCVSCFLRKLSKAVFEVNYELSFLDKSGSSLRCIKVSNATFNKHSKSVQLWLHHDEIFGNEAVFYPQDILSIRCRMWTGDASILQMKRYFTTTEIKVQQCMFVWYINGFAGLQAGKKRTELVKDVQTGVPCISFNFFLDEWNSYIFEITILDPPLVEICKCQIFLLCANGERLKCGRFEVVTVGKTTDPDWKFQLSLCKRNLLKNRNLYVSKNTLTLECEVAFASEIEVGHIQKQELDHQNMTSNEDISKIGTFFQECIQPPYDPNGLEELNGSFNPLKGDYSTSSKTSADSDTKYLKENYSESLLATMNDLQFSAEAHGVSSLAWKDDMLTIYKNGLLCDAELQTNSELFPVHSLILRVKSPVFCDLLASRTEAKQVVHLDNLDPDTVRRMILFMYTDTLEISDCDAAKRLYVAAHKYEIPCLLQKCLLFLNRNLNPSICCDLLPLADRLQDKTLKQTVHNYVVQHADDTIYLDQWKNLEETHPSLILETFRIMYLKKSLNTSAPK